MICFFRCKQAASNKTKSGLEPDSKINMKEFMIAILEDNPKSERTIGFSDADFIEIFQQSMEIIALEEQFAKKATFNDIAQFMIK